MSRGTAIKAYCRGCAGGSSLEVVVCHLVDCPLWQYRTGYSEVRTAVSVKAAFASHPEIEKEIAALGLDTCFLRNPIKKTRLTAKKSPKTTRSQGVGRRAIKVSRLKEQGDALTGARSTSGPPEA